MSLRLRLLLLMLAIYGAGGYFITRWIIDQVRPRYLESMEETLVDTSVLLASIVEVHDGETLNPGVIRDAYQRAIQHRLAAKVFSLEKQAIDLRVYVTDASGRVVFDSRGVDEGKDYSRWNDVSRTLRGGYGARSSRDVAGDDDTQVIYVAAPVHRDGRIIGVVTVGKPTRGINELVVAAKHRILVGAVSGGVILLVVLLVAAAWVIAPLERLTAYARAVRDGRVARPPSLPGRTLKELGTAFEEMRDALEGRQHAERYTRALAHEVKAPLAAIRGAAELLDERMPEEQRAKFLANIRAESARIQQIIDRLLELSSLELRKALGGTERIAVPALLQDAAETMQGAYASAGVRLQVEVASGLAVQGDRFLLRQALLNLLQNAVDFSPRGGEVRLAAQVTARPAVTTREVAQDAERETASVGRGGGGVEFTVEDQGPGVPEYALGRVFERFYSLPRPGGAQKSTGIGLALVREIAHLHGGDARLENRPGGGAVATLHIPARER